MKRFSASWTPDEAAAANARRVLPDMVRNYYKAGRKLDADSPARDMHGFRLLTKQLRYTLEAFVPLYGRGLEPRVDRLRPIQSALGDLNDCEVMLSEMKKQLPDSVRAYIEKRARKKRKEFLQYWRKEFDADGQEKKWENYLGRSPRTTPARAKTAKTKT